MQTENPEGIRESETGKTANTREGANASATANAREAATVPATANAALDATTRPANPALDAAVRLYADIADEYLEAVRATGVEFAPADEERLEARDLISRLEAAGARVRNGGASIVLGDMSPACVACTGDCASQTLEISNNCHRDCYFCFNPNQEDFAYYCEHFFPWRSQLDRLAKEGRPYAAIALTGGEPMLYPEETCAFFRRARKHFPQAHLRLYTSGDLLDHGRLADLRDSGLDEIRFSVKLDDPPKLKERVMKNIARSMEYIERVMVEMPVIPGTEDEMRSLLRELDALGVDAINLLEFAYPLWNWEAFASRGFTLRNPPFDVMYDYVYAGSLAVAGSEELALGLMLWAHEEGLHIGLHYCSLENKHRSQIRQANGPCATLNPNYAFDFGDFFLKTIQVFGPDRSPVRGALRLLGCRDYLEDAECASLSFHPRYYERVRRACLAAGEAVRFCVSTNVVVEKDGAPVFRELKVVECASATCPVELADTTRAMDEASGLSIVP